MFNKEFYPTPLETILLMIEDLELKGKTVLEPQAGKGDIIDVLKTQGAKVVVCENNPDLAGIAWKKADVFLKQNFFDVKAEEVSHIDYIIMNPPFSNADEHIVHAWNVAPEGCQIISLCNTETIKNVGTRKRRVLRALIKDRGNSTSIGNAFSTAERKTDVDVSLIKLIKPRTGEDEFKDYLFSDEEEEQNHVAGLVQHSYVREIVGRYIQGVQMYDSVIEASKKINEVIAPLDGSFKLQFDTVEQRGTIYSTITRDEYKNKLQKSAWKAVFNKLKMQKYLTSSVMEQVNKFVEQQQDKPFTMKNIFTMVQVIMGTHTGRMKNVVAEVFDWLTEHHHENRLHVEGWKTNSMYMVNKKFIAPWCGVSMGYSGQPEIAWGSRGSDRFDELIKGLCFITGKNYDDCTPLYTFFKEDTKEWGKWYDWDFFQIKVFKKGTLHAKFRDVNTWEKFNREAAKIKGWKLPEKTASDFRQKTTGLEVYS